MIIDQFFEIIYICMYMRTPTTERKKEIYVYLQPHENKRPKKENNSSRKNDIRSLEKKYKRKIKISRILSTSLFCYSHELHLTKKKELDELQIILFISFNINTPN